MSWNKLRITPAQVSDQLRITPSGAFQGETLMVRYKGGTPMWCLPAGVVIQSECTLWHFINTSLIPGGRGLIQTETHSFQREYSQPCLLLVTVIFGVSSELGVIIHTPLRVLTPVLHGAEESKHITRLLWKHARRQSKPSSHELGQTGGLSERD